MRRLLDKNIFLNQSGVAAIFVVIFFALLIGIITLSFATIANQDQQRSTNNDLAQSAYDSSQAGVEDSRRLLLSYYKCIQDGGACATDSTLKDKYEANFNKDDCKAIVDAAGVNLIKVGSGTIQSGSTVVPIKSSNGGDLQQSYTCVNIKTKTPDYQTSLKANQSRLIPLKAAGGAHTPEITLSWFMADRDAGSGSNFNYPDGTTSPLVLPADSSAWNADTPSIIRVQAIPVASSGPVNPAAVNDGSRTLFLYPQEGATTPEIDLNIDGGRKISKTVATPTPAPGCVVSKTANAYGFACKAKMIGFDTTKDYYLRITPLYNKSTINITMASTLLFDNVQPTIDSTGRANDLYRRSFTRMNPININDVTFDADFTSTDSICKDYSVGGTTTDFNPGSCN
jgi:Tfp pilus assembly protein PilX